jgi:hypothetical protein
VLFKDGIGLAESIAGGLDTPVGSARLLVIFADPLGIIEGMLVVLAG